MKYLTLTLPDLLRRERSLLFTALLLFICGVASAFLLVQSHPRLVYLMYGEYQLQELTRGYQAEIISLGRYQPRDLWHEVLFYFLNNSLVGLQLFLAGLLPVVGPLLLLLYGSLSLGSLMGHIYASGLGAALWPAIIGHSALELFATVLAASAGFRLGLWLLAGIRDRQITNPGTMFRHLAHLLMLALVLYGIGALIEAGWSHHPLVSAGMRYGLGMTIWVLFIAYGIYVFRTPRYA